MIVRVWVDTFLLSLSFSLTLTHVHARMHTHTQSINKKSHGKDQMTRITLTLYFVEKMSQTKTSNNRKETVTGGHTKNQSESAPTCGLACPSEIGH